MTCAEVRGVLDAFLDGELDGAEEAALCRHLDGCAACGRELDELRDWHGAVGDALTSEEPDPAAVAESRRAILKALSSTSRTPVSRVRVAALLAIGLSVGVVAVAVGFLPPPEAQVARLVERLKEQEHQDARLRAVNREIRRDLVEARNAVAGLGDEDPVARAIEVATLNLSRRLSRDIPDPQASAAETLSVTREGDAGTVSVVQKSDGRVLVHSPAGVVEARNMPDLLSRHPDLCRRYSIGGSDGLVRVGDSSAGVDWRGRVELLLRSGSWDETLQQEAYRGWLARRSGDPKEIERRLQEHQERSREGGASVTLPAVDARALADRVKTWTRAELRRHQERLEAEMKRMEQRLREAAELRARARGLRLFAEDAGHD